MAALISGFQRLQKIETACAAKDDPAPVYLLDEILELARSSPEEAQAIADAVERKLANRSPVVKFKALRVIKHLCTKGCSSFQRCMQRHSGAVRELVHFRGEPDPFKGDVPNARVREFAKEVLEALFNANPVTATTAAAGTLAAQGRIQGFGSGGPEAPSRPGYGGGGGGYSGGAGAGGGLSALSNAAASLGDGPLAAGVATVASAINDFLGNSSARAGLTGSRYGGSSSPRRNNGYGGFEPMGGYGSSSSAAPAVPHVSPSQVLGSEESLVDDVCMPGGLRPAPDASDLRRFVEAASAMDGLRLAELLRAKMEAPAGPGNGWQVALRALCALEAVLQRGSNQACGEVAVMFQSEPTTVQALATSSQPLVRDAAARCLRLLLGEDAVPQAAAAGPAAGAGKKAPKPAAPTQDLLSLDDGPAPSGAPAPPAAAASPAAALDLLGDLAGPAPAAAAAPAATAPAAAAAGGSLFVGLEVAGPSGSSAAVAAPSAAAAVDDLFGGLSLAPAAAAPAAAPLAAAAPAPAAPWPAAAAPQQPAAVPLDDLFSGINATAPAAPAAFPQQPAQHAFPTQQQAAVQMQALGGLGAPVPAVKAPHGGMAAAHGRVLAAGGAGGSFSPTSAAAAVAQQPWSAGITRDHAAFDFVLDEFGKK